MGKYGLRARQKLEVCDKCNESFERKSGSEIHYCSHKNEQKEENTTEYCILNKITNDSEPYRNDIKKSLKTYGKKTKVLSKTQKKEIKNSRETVSNVCQATVSNKKPLNKHKRTQRRIKLFTCNVCGVEFVSKQNLISHLSTHDVARPYICDVCHKAYVKKCNLDIHYRIHTGIKPFACEICHESFSNRSLLGTHKLVHIDENYKCDSCPRTFRLKGHMICHMRRVHGTEWTDQSSIEGYVYSFDTDPFVCGVCSTEFRDLSSLEMHDCPHAEQKPFTCNMCVIAFSTEAEFNQHNLSHESLI